MVQNDIPWSNLGFAEEPAIFNAHVLSAANSPVADFHCGVCAEECELKATKGRIDRRLVNGAYGAMTARLAAANNPNSHPPGEGALRLGILQQTALHGADRESNRVTTDASERMASDRF